MASSLPIPFSEPPWLQGVRSPYYQEKHLAWQRECRKFIDANLIRSALDYEREGTVPEEVFTNFANANFLIPALPTPLPVQWLQKLGLDILPGGLKAKDFDGLHTMIFFDEMARSGLVGPSVSLTTSMAFGVPPILKYGSKKLQEKFLPGLLTGRKRTCIAITEPDAGSDIANITTVAKLSPDGKHFIVNGTKKWITNGIWCEYSTMAVRSDGPGPGGLSLLVIPLKGYPGITMKRLKMAGQNTAGTTYIELDDVKVPVENLIGERGAAMKYIMTNFNHERLTIAVVVARQARVALAASFAYCLKREAFGKVLMDQPVVRQRIARCGSELEGLSAWIEQLAYKLTVLPREEADLKLGGLTAMIKAQAGVVLDECGRCAALLFGGNGYTATGQGELVERIYREINAARIPGGSEDVMFDLGVRQLVKRYRQAKNLLEKSKGSSRL